MTKVRADDTRVFPPLPEDSPLRKEHSRDGVYALDNAIYVLRPYPRPEPASPDLKPYIADKGDPDWPEVVADTDLKKFETWLGTSRGRSPGRSPFGRTERSVSRSPFRS